MAKDKKENLYENKYQIKPLKFFIVIVNKHQGDYFVQEFIKKGVAATILNFGKGTADTEIINGLGFDEKHKDIITCLVKSSEISKLEKICQSRFDLSEEASGIAFSIPVDSMIGVLHYKFITDTKENKKRRK